MASRLQHSASTARVSLLRRWVPSLRRHWSSTVQVEDDESGGMYPPLVGLKVLDLSSALSGPMAAGHLGDLGADVWKLEVPRKGDDIRWWGPPFTRHKPTAPPRWDPKLDFESASLSCTNRNKRSLTVDLKQPEGLAIAKRLADKADILIENLITGKLAKIGLGYEVLSKTNPGLIYCSITGYGQTGSYATAPGYDAVVAGEGGIVHATGEPDRLPVRPQVAITDHWAGFNASAAILAALVARKSTGKGVHIDVSMFDCQLASLGNAGSSWLHLGIENTRYTTGAPGCVPYQAFKTADGHVMLGVGTDGEFAAFARAINDPDLITDPRFSTNEVRVENREVLIPRLQKLFLMKTTPQWIEELVGKGFPLGAVNNMENLFSHPQIVARDAVSYFDHPFIETVGLINPPIIYNGQRMKTRTVPPVLGLHTREILQEELGMGYEEIEELRSAGIL